MVANAATPLLGFQAAIDQRQSGTRPSTPWRLRCQIQLEVTRRKYTAEDQERLLDLFGEPSRWGQTLRNLLWTHANLVVPSFQGQRWSIFRCRARSISMWLPPNISTVWRTETFPICLQFSGTVFYAASEGGAAGRAHFLGQGGPLQAAGKVVARHDGDLLSQQRLAVPAQRCFRPAVSIQSAARNSHLGRSAREPASGGRDGELDESWRSVEQIAKAVLYEGYMLYPYRPSSVKNQQRWNFGVLYPAVLQRSAEGQRSLDHADGVPGRRQFA